MLSFLKSNVAHKIGQNLNFISFWGGIAYRQADLNTEPALLTIMGANATLVKLNRTASYS